MLLAQRADASVKDNRLGMRIGVAKQKKQQTTTTSQFLAVHCVHFPK
jgi:hypothetical protein